MGRTFVGLSLIKTDADLANVLLISTLNVLLFESNKNAETAIDVVSTLTLSSLNLP